MFRGFELAQLRMIMALTAILFLGVALGRWNRNAPTPVTISGPAVVHSPGTLAQAPLPTPTPLAAVVIDPLPSPAAMPEPAPAAPVLAPGGLVDVSTASAETLDLLPGIGPARARAIVDTRTARGGFRQVEDLLEVPGIGEASLARLRPMITVSGQAPVAATASTPAARRLVAINRAEVRELEELEMVGPVMARRILEDRVRNGPFRTPQDLLRVKGIGQKFLERNAARIDYAP